jgi:hypothetical protein
MIKHELNPKPQAPNPKEIPNPKTQMVPWLVRPKLNRLSLHTALELGVWGFFGAWNLELGASASTLANH